MRKLLACEKGNFMVVFALTVVPVMGAAGVATDYSRALNVRSYLQSQTDMAVLAAAQLGPAGDDGPILDYLRYATQQRYGGDWIDALKIKGEWVTPVDYRVSVDGKVPTSILSGVPGFPDAVPIGVSATARAAEPRYVYKAPEVSELDNEAGDYNRIYVYCFNPEKKKDKKTRGRTQMTAIADNASTKYEYEMPRCDAGEMLSFKLLNGRHVRDTPHLWDSSKPRFEYFTDTVLDQNGADRHDISCSGHDECKKPPSQGWSIMETVLCNTKQECTPKSQGGIIPEGKNRTPVQATQTCSPGKYMYYGWEDRPPGLEKHGTADWTQLGWTDRDYDDIRIVLACPSLEPVEERMVRLVD